MTKVFISYSQKDKVLARQIYKYLKNSTKAWLDENEILVGDSIPNKIQEGITSSDYILVLFTKNSVESGWVKREIESKLVNEISTGNISIIPILGESLDKTWSLPPLLASKKYADISIDFEKGMKEVLYAISGHNNSYKKPSSKNVYLGYAFGFTAAKVAWHYGETFERMGLIIQYKEFASKLRLEEALIDETLKAFKPSSDFEDIIKNAHQGLNIRQAMSSILIVKHGEIVSGAFRFGFNSIYILPQLEFLGVAKEKSSKLPIDNLLGPLRNQFNDLVSDGEILELEADDLQTLKQAFDNIFQIGALRVRELLIEIGLNVEKKLKT